MPWPIEGHSLNRRERRFSEFDRSRLPLQGRWTILDTGLRWKAVPRATGCGRGQTLSPPLLAPSCRSPAGPTLRRAASASWHAWDRQRVRLLKRYVSWVQNVARPRSAQKTRTAISPRIGPSFAQGTKRVMAMFHQSSSSTAEIRVFRTRCFVNNPQVAAGPPRAVLLISSAGTRARLARSRRSPR